MAFAVQNNEIDSASSMLLISQNNSEMPRSQNASKNEEGPFATIGGSIFKVIAMFVGKNSNCNICNTYGSVQHMSHSLI